MGILNHFPNVKVLVAGDLMLDRYFWGDVNRISPEAPVPVVRLRGSSFAPGGAANVASNVAGLKASPVLIGAVGNDEDANVLRHALSDQQIDPGFIVELPGRTTTVKTRIVAHGQHVVRLDREDTLSLTEKEEKTILERIDQSIDNVDVILISDYGKGFLSNNVLNHLIQQGKRLEKPVIIDPKGKKYGKYTGATLLTPNRREAAEACALNEEFEDLVNVAGRMLLDEFLFDFVLITQSEQGMTLFSKECEPQHIPATAVETYDVTGAGDTVIATLSVAKAAGADFAEAARIANTAAGLVVQQVGTTAIRLEQLLDALRV